MDMSTLKIRENKERIENMSKASMVALMCCGLVLSSMVRAESAQTTLVETVDLDVLVRTLLGSDVSLPDRRAQCRGILVSLIQDEKTVGAIQIGVFENSSAAMVAFKDHMMFTSVSPNKNISDVLGDKAVAWKKRVVFVRDNVTVSLSWDSAVVLKKAQAIDALLRQGGAGVVRGNEASVPQFAATYFRSENSDEDVSFEVAFSPEGGVDGYWSVVDRRGMVSSRFRVTAVKRSENMPRKLSIEISDSARGTKISREEFALCFVTPGCVVVAKPIDFGFGNLKEQLPVVGKERKEIEEKILQALKDIENSEPVQQLKKDLEETRAAQRTLAESFPEAQELKKRRQVMEEERKSLLLERSQISGESRGKLEKTALKLKEAETALSAAVRANRAKDSNADVESALTAQKKAVSAHATAEASIPEIKEIDERIEKLTQAINQLMKNTRKVVLEHPKMQELNKARIHLEETLTAARRVETPELKMLRAKQSELKSQYASLREQEGR